MQGLNNTGFLSILTAQKSVVVILFLLLPFTKAYGTPFSSAVIGDGATSNESNEFKSSEAATSALFIDFNVEAQKNPLVNTFNSMASVSNQTNTHQMLSKPEPNSLALLGLGVLSLISYRRKQN